MSDIIRNEKMMKLIKSISSNLLRAQSEERSGGESSDKNYYLDLASVESVYLAKLLYEIGEYNESSRYFLSAAHSYERAGAFNQSRACYDKLMECGVQEYIDKAKEGLDRLSSIKDEEIDITSKEGKIKALDLLIWQHRGITTTKARNYLLEEFGIDSTNGSIRNYAIELKKRKRATIWGGPQGREYHIFPNIADLATRGRDYGNLSFYEGSIESRITDEFNINFEALNHIQELFILNEFIKPKMIMAIDVEGLAHLERIAKNDSLIKTQGVLRRFSDLQANGYERSQDIELDVIDSEIICDNRGKVIYQREIPGASLNG